MGLGVNGNSRAAAANHAHKSPSPGDMRVALVQDNMLQVEGMNVPAGLAGNTIVYGWNGLRSFSKTSGRLSSVDHHHRNQKKRFFMEINYSDLSDALIRRGWVPCGNEVSDHQLSLKFSLTSAHIDYYKLPKDALINHCRGESAITCKTQLIDTLTENFHFWASWFADKNTGVSDIKIRDYSVAGVDSFFPKCFVLSNLADQGNFFAEMVFIAAESYLKLFIREYEKGNLHLMYNCTSSNTALSQDGANNSPKKPSPPRMSFIKEKLVVCSNLVLRRLKEKQIDARLEQKQGADKVINGLELNMKEHNFLFRASYPASYLKFIKKEDWYLAMKKEVKQYFIKDKKLDSKEERRKSLWANVYKFAKELIET